MVTGGARGIGRAIAECFLDVGATVHVLDMDGAALAAWKGQIHRANGTVSPVFHRTDIRNGAAVARAFRCLPRIDVLVNNAARPFYRPFQDLTRREWEQAICNDLHGAFECTRQALSRLRKSRQAAIVNITSIEATRAEPGTVAYGSAKGALEQFTRSLAVDLGPDGIRVNAIAPGATVVERNRKIFEQKKWRKIFRARIPLTGAPGEGRDIANAAVFLASPLARYITGATLAVDGGWSCLL